MRDLRFWRWRRAQQDDDSSLLYRVSPLDPAAFLTAVLVLAAATLLACYIPARRATRIATSEALRTE
jgi:ABC-type antimicrobial peptide transport system permease subunit